MAHEAAVVLFGIALVGVVVAVVQHVLLRGHLRAPEPEARACPPVSILKPLCGVDDGLEENLAAFAALDYPEYEVVLGLKSARDPAWDVACGAARRWPGRFRVALQRGAPGMNPKVNQLVTLARAARHDLLVVSDSNVRVRPGYLRGIAAHLADPAVGLVTHPIVGVGERRLGSALDALHLAGAIAPGVVAAKRLAGQDIVVGKSMAFRRADLVALGGFEAVKDVLAEDFVLGRMVTTALGKRVAVAREPIQNVSHDRSLREFAGRYGRWYVMQRQAAGPLLYLGGALLNPVLAASLAAAADRTPDALAAAAGIAAVKAAVDGASGRLLRPGGFTLRQLALVPAKDLVVGAAWLRAFVRREIDWRGNRLVVQPGTRIAPPAPAAPALGLRHDAPSA
jgi:ceramide glucosyltransferase